MQAACIGLSLVKYLLGPVLLPGVLGSPVRVVRGQLSYWRIVDTEEGGEEDDEDEEGYMTEDSLDDMTYEVTGTSSAMACLLFCLHFIIALWPLRSGLYEGWNFQRLLPATI